MEVTDMLNGLDSVIEHDNRTIGNQQMQTAVLRWAVERRASLQSLLLADSLIECMNRQLEQMKRDRPSTTDSFRAIRQVNAERDEHLMKGEK